MNSVLIKRQLWLSVDRKQVLCLIMQNGSYCKIGYSFGPLSDRSPWEKQTERIRKCQYQRYSNCAQCECLNKSCIPVSLNDSHRALLFLPGAPLWWCWRPPSCTLGNRTLTWGNGVGGGICPLLNSGTMWALRAYTCCFCSTRGSGIQTPVENFGEWFLVLGLNSEVQGFCVKHLCSVIQCGFI